jgi:NADH-quinone oxidoreductase subunit C
MALENSVLQEAVEAKFGTAVTGFNEPWGMLTFEVEPGKVIELMRFLKEDETLNFNFLTTLCAVHYPNNEADRQIEMVYQMHNWFNNTRIRFKAYLNGDAPEIETATTLFLCANWMEREAYDFYGVIFTGHPDLKRILNMDEMVSFPMRKEFPMEDGSRTDKDDRYFGREPQNKSLS